MHFHGLRGMMGSIFQTLRKEGLGAEVKQAYLITLKEEEKLWESKTLGDHNPSSFCIG